MRKLIGRLLAALFKRDEQLLEEVVAALGVEETLAVREARQRAYERWRERCAGGGQQPIAGVRTAGRRRSDCGHWRR